MHIPCLYAICTVNMGKSMNENKSECLQETQVDPEDGGQHWAPSLSCYLRQHDSASCRWELLCLPDPVLTHTAISPGSPFTGPKPVEKAHPHPRSPENVTSCLVPTGWWEFKMCVCTKYWSCEHVPPVGAGCAKEAKLGQESPGGRENSPSHRQPIVSSPDN